MIQILGDNQFFGVNHNDIDKGNETKDKFKTDDSIVSFIYESLSIGLNGFMINSNIRGYNIVNSISNNVKGEIHYSIPYPHKFASMVNEGGMLNLIKYIINNSSFKSLFIHLPRFLFFGNVKYLIPLILDLEIPPKLSKGSYVYLQNIVTDLILGIKRYDLLESFCISVTKKGFKPGLITLNPVLLDNVLSNLNNDIQDQLIVCFNINNAGFNVFPNLVEVEKFACKKTKYKKMAMSIFSSGGSHNIQSSIEYIKQLSLDYVVYGSSKIKNIKTNFDQFVK